MVVLASVLLTTYNKPKYLQHSIEGYLHQSVRDFELIIADDGSKKDTKEVIDKYKRIADFPIKHIWQEDKGYRRAKILNEAVKNSSGDLLIFSDGDCIPYENLVKAYLDHCRGNCFMVGGVLMISQDDTQTLLDTDCSIRDLSAIKRPLPLKLRWKHTKNIFYIFFKYRKARIFGLNFAVDRNSYYEVNGFDENFEGWGQEDSDIRDRFLLQGIKPISLMTSALVYHLWHPRTLGRTERMRDSWNWQYYKRPNKQARCANGLIKEPGAN
jgi:glycosyltransferase involved in cell wall biosynthesis